MTPHDLNGIAAALAALTEIPGRLAALELEQTKTRSEVQELRSALPPLLVSIPDAAREFKVSVQTMRRWVKAGALPTVRVGSTIRIDLRRLRGTDDLSIARARLTRDCDGRRG
ncbi:MAG TPA: helix-turn-helix domain-containing protein [Polyangia bacterium]|nr:helix-turn-helix domain-containing protein [Polyangia bacterium]